VTTWPGVWDAFLTVATVVGVASLVFSAALILWALYVDISNEHRYRNRPPTDDIDNEYRQLLGDEPS
jgi:hypothetical protein